MKWTVLVPFTIAAFLVATAFRLATQAVTPQKSTTRQPVTQQKKIAVRCAPGYIPAAGDDIPPLTGWGNFKWKVSTQSDSAQFYFNQGMALYYSFHIIESRASFDKATGFDPACAMAWWGKALAFGPNINDFGYVAPLEAFPSAAKAASLKASCTPVEKALIDAIAIRYSADSAANQAALNEKYRDAMSGVHQRYPTHAEVAALYADALMLLHPWDLYNQDFSPKPWTPQIVGTIKKALKLAPSHPGANHYLIHAVEASARPGDALKSAELLATAMPDVAHLTHMPSHVYIRTGYYNKGIGLNTKAVAGFKRYQAAFAPAGEGLFLYSLHNLHMKMACAQMAGNYTEALSAAKELQEAIPPDYLTSPGPVGHYLQYMKQSPLLTYIRFGKWEEILKESLQTLPYASVLQHFARGLALARLDRLEEAQAEAAQMEGKMQEPELKEPLTPFNAAYDGAEIAFAVLKGVIATQQNNLPQAIEQFEAAVKNDEYKEKPLSKGLL